MPKILVFAGANGSGKTTLANSVVESNMKFINADKIKDRDNLSYIEASKKAITLIDGCISKGASFSFETTMSGLTLQNKFEQLKQKKYHIAVFYLFVHPVELLIERIKERVKKGGHFVDDKDVVRRYYRSTVNFWNIYRYYADEWIIINNNEFQYKNITIGAQDNFTVIDKIEFEKFKKVVVYAKTYK
ncbi:MAG: zeta toxin family protein [Candidatus Omnitrophota bacterium]